MEYTCPVLNPSLAATCTWRMEPTTGGGCTVWHKMNGEDWGTYLHMSDFDADFVVHWVESIHRQQAPLLDARVVS